MTSINSRRAHVFLIHGLSRPWHFSRSRRRLHSKEWMVHFLDHLSTRCEIHIHPFYWDGRLSRVWFPHTVSSCGEALRRFFDLSSARAQPSRPNRIIITKSAGAFILDRALARFAADLPSNSIDLEIRIAAPFHSHPSTARLCGKRIFVKSPQDKLYKLARSITRLIVPFRKVADPYQSIIQISGLSHHDLNLNIPINIAGTTMGLHDLYASLICSSPFDIGRILGTGNIVRGTRLHS